MSTPESPNHTLRNNRLSTTRQSTLINTSGHELGTTGATDQCSYRAYLRRIRGSPAYWFLYDQMHIFAGVPYNPPTYNPVNPVSILEVASDGSTKLFNYETIDDLKMHLKSPFARNGYDGMPNQGRRVVLVTDIQETVLEVLGDTYGMDFGFFADHLIPDEHISYTSKTTRGSHLHILEENKPESRRFQFEYRELGRTRGTHRDTRNVCRIFEKPSGPLNWDAIFQRRFSCFTCSPPGRGLTTDIYLFDEHAFRGPFALTSRLNLPSFLEFKEGEAAFDSQRTPFQQELVDFFKSSDFNAIRAFENSSYLLAYILRLTLIMWRHLLVRIEHSFLGAMEGRITSDDVHDLTGGSLSSVSAELSKCAQLIVRKTIPTIKALSQDPKTRSDLDGVLEEFTSLCEDMHYVSMRAEKAHSIVLTKLTIVESKKAIEHSIMGIELARRVGRLTYLAFIFVPLSFVASFLGMNGISLENNFTAETKRVIWVFWVLSIPLVLITVFLAVPYRLLSSLKRTIYLLQRLSGIGWIYEKEEIEKYYPEGGGSWQEYHRWLCSLGWEQIEDSSPRNLFVMESYGRCQEGREIQRKVGLTLGTYLQLAHAWKNIR